MARVDAERSRARHSKEDQCNSCTPACVCLCLITNCSLWLSLTLNGGSRVGRPAKSHISHVPLLMRHEHGHELWAPPPIVLASPIASTGNDMEIHLNIPTLAYALSHCQITERMKISVCLTFIWERSASTRSRRSISMDVGHRLKICFRLIISSASTIKRAAACYSFC